MLKNGEGGYVRAQQPLVDMAGAHVAWMAKVSARPAFAAGGVSDLAELRAGCQLPSTGPPDLRAEVMGRRFPLHGISVQSFLIDLRQAGPTHGPWAAHSSGGFECGPTHIRKLC